MMNEPLISIYTTVYNNARTVERSIESIIKQLEGFSYEIVVVDNFSTDGTYEKLVELSKKYPIRVYRYHCNRGLGRRLAARLSRGRYLVYVDLDCIYTDTLRKLIELHLRSEFRDAKCLHILICPRDVLLRENYMPLNRSEDVELAARLSRRGYLYVIPRLKGLVKPLRYDLHLQVGSVGKLIPTMQSELRYVKSLLGYFKRELRNKIDYVKGSGATPSKFVREEYFIWRKWRGFGVFTVLLRSIGFLVVYLLAKILRVERYVHDEDLTNHFYNDFMLLKDVALPQELGLTCSDIELPKLSEMLKYLEYVLRFKDAAIFRRLWVLYKTCGYMSST